MNRDTRELVALYAGLAMLGEVTALRGKHTVVDAEVAKHAFDLADAMVNEHAAREPVADTTGDVIRALQAEVTALQTGLGQMGQERHEALTRLRAYEPDATVGPAGDAPPAADETAG
jgi:hypothetical protein